MKGDRPRLGPLCALALLLVAGLAGCGEDTAPAPEPEEPGTGPNIVLIVTDDQRPASFTREVMPKAFRHLVDRGTFLDSVTLPTPVCCPSRAVFLTGQYVHNNGVPSNHDGYRALRDKENVLPEWLRRAGYRTAHFGKFLHGYQKSAGKDKPAPGWTHWHSIFDYRYRNYSEWINGEETKRGTAPEEHLTAVLNRRAIDWAREAAQRPGPFYLQLDHYAPHFEGGDGDGKGPCRRYARPEKRDERLLERPAPRPSPSYDERDVSDKPRFVSSQPRLNRGDHSKMDLAARCERASLAGVDRGIAELVEALDEEGVLDETAILLTTDNGLMLGEHRLTGKKTSAYREANEVPLIARLPVDLAPREPGSRVRASAAGVDLAPTILALAGAKPCLGDETCRIMDGRSLLPALRGRKPGFPERRPIPLEYKRPPDSTGSTCEYQGVRVGPEVWVHHTLSARDDSGKCKPVDDIEYYELDRDPWQLENLTGKPTVQQEERRLRRLADRMSRCQGIEGRDPEPPDDRPWCR